MKPLMKPIDTPDQVFHDGDPSTGELGTICSAEWLNDTQASIRDIQAECITILRANSLEPDETKRDQLWEAIQAAIKNHVPAASLVGAGIVQLSSSVTSDSETIAATLKAVKIAMDNGNARMAKDRNGSDIPNKALFRQNLELGNSATRNVGTTTGTVAAGDDVRITGAMQKAMNGSDIPDKAAFCRALGLGALATSDGIDALIKSQNGADIPDKALFVQNLGLTETVNKAAGAMQRDQNGADIPDKPLFVKTLGIVDSYPAGCPIPYPGPVAPDGYLLMDGRPFSKPLYPQLAKLYVDGVLPDMRGMFVRGLDNVGRIDKSGIHNSLSIADPDLPSDWTSNGRTPIIQADIGGLGKRYVYDSGLNSVRGYRLVCNYTANFPSRSHYKLYETSRTLLSTQYINTYLRNPDTYASVAQTFYVSEKDPYKLEAPTYADLDNFASLKNEIKKRNISLVLNTTEPRYEIIRNIMEQRGDNLGSIDVNLSNLLPSAAPNVAFNYITKAA